MDIHNMTQWEKENLCTVWQNYPIGTLVIVTDDLGEEHYTVTTSDAFMLGGHTPVISTGWRKCYLLTRIRLDIDTTNENKAICPYCGYALSDSWEWGQGDHDGIECGNCCREFTLNVEARYYYSTYPSKEKSNA